MPCLWICWRSLRPRATRLDSEFQKVLSKKLFVLWRFWASALPKVSKNLENCLKKILLKTLSISLALMSGFPSPTVVSCRLSRRADDCRKNSAIWGRVARASERKADKCDKTFLTRSPLAVGSWGVFEQNVIKMTWQGIIQSGEGGWAAFCPLFPLTVPDLPVARRNQPSQRITIKLGLSSKLSKMIYVNYESLQLGYNDIGFIRLSLIWFEVHMLVHSFFLLFFLTERIAVALNNCN